tara:strand:+ start:1030 stop:1164 length:135 start_codon:yes stop_codon:yes gene_type:complete
MKTMAKNHSFERLKKKFQELARWIERSNAKAADKVEARAAAYKP